MEILLLTNVFSFSLPEFFNLRHSSSGRIIDLLTWRIDVVVSINGFQPLYTCSTQVYATRTIIFNMKLISDLKVGDKIFVIDNLDRTFDIAEVIEVSNTMIRLQFYFDTFNNTCFIWKYQESKHRAPWYTFFTDEIEALEEFRRTLKWQE